MSTFRTISLALLSAALLLPLSACELFGGRSAEKRLHIVLSDGGALHFEEGAD
jgi:hypothetical protein